MGDMQSAEINSMRGNQGAGRERRVRNIPGDKSIEREVKGRETDCSSWYTVKHSMLLLCGTDTVRVPNSLGRHSTIWLNGYGSEP